jgi:chromosomal replication initiator protein
MLAPSDRPQLHPAFVHQPIRKIILAIAELSLLTELQIKGPSRQRAISQARHAGMWCARQLTDASFPDIGRAFGNLDHTSVLYGVKMFEQRSTPEVREDLLNEVCKRTGIRRRTS